MALRGYLAQVKASSTPIAFTDEATTSGDNLSYVITDSNKAIWDLNTTIVVEDSAVPTTEEYTVSRLTGTVTFTSAVARVITVTGAYVALTTVAEAKSFTFAGSSDALDATKFNVTGFRDFQVGNVTATAELGKFLETSTFFLDMLLDGEIKVIEYYPNNALDPIRFFALANTRNAEAPQAGLEDETISFNVTNEIEV